jgi:probable phosphoglycerate mutase
MDHPASIIVASPLRRARETAQIVAEAVDRPVETDPRWMEMGFGSVEGLTFDEASIAWPAVIARLSAGDLAIDWPDGETSHALRERVTAALDDVLGRDVPVLVVGHGIAIRAALMVLVGTPAEPDSLPVLAPAGFVVARQSGRSWFLEAPELDGDRA